VCFKFEKVVIVCFKYVELFDVSCMINKWSYVKYIYELWTCRGNK